MILRRIQLRHTILSLCLTNCMELSLSSDVQSSPSQATFKSGLKTHLFNIAFNDQPELWCCVTSLRLRICDTGTWRVTNWIIIYSYTGRGYETAEFQKVRSHRMRHRNATQDNARRRRAPRGVVRFVLRCVAAPDLMWTRLCSSWLRKYMAQASVTRLSQQRFTEVSALSVSYFGLLWLVTHI